eukprot:3353982-Pyramimonas_sp.AAC.1
MSVEAQASARMLAPKLGAVTVPQCENRKEKPGHDTHTHTHKQTNTRFASRLVGSIQRGQQQDGSSRARTNAHTHLHTCA